MSLRLLKGHLREHLKVMLTSQEEVTVQVNWFTLNQAFK